MKKAVFNLFAAIGITAGMFMVSCGHNNTNYAELVDKQWNLTEVIHKDSSSAISIPAGVNIIFADSSRVYGNAGCNNINGMYHHTGIDHIRLERIASTMMWCPSMDFETAYLKWLDKVETYKATADRLELHDAGNNIRLIFNNGGPARE